MFEHNHIPEMVQEILRGKALAHDRRGRDRQRRVRQRGRAEEPAPRRHHRRARGRGAEPAPRRGRRRGDAESQAADARRRGPARDLPGAVSRRAARVQQTFTEVATVGPCARHADSPATPRWSDPGSSTHSRCSPRSPTSWSSRTARDTHDAVLDRVHGRSAARSPGPATACRARAPRHRRGRVRRPRPRPAPRGDRPRQGRRRPASARGSRPIAARPVRQLGGQRPDRRPAGPGAAQLAIPMAVRADGRDVPLEPDALAAAFPDAGGRRGRLPARPLRERVLLEPRPRRASARRTARRWPPRAGPRSSCAPTPASACARTASRWPPCCRTWSTAWPVEVERIALVGHSMGGLIMRAAGAVATEVEPPWTELVSDVVTLGTPHLGAPIARGRRRTAAAGSAGCPRRRRSAGSWTGARSACTTWSPAWPRTCRPCRTRATAWSPPPSPTSPRHPVGHVRRRPPGAGRRRRTAATGGAPSCSPAPTSCTSAGPTTSACSTTPTCTRALRRWLA